MGSNELAATGSLLCICVNPCAWIRLRSPRRLWLKEKNSSSPQNCCNYCVPIELVTLVFDHFTAKVVVTRSLREQGYDGSNVSSAESGPIARGSLAEIFVARMGV